MPSPIRDNAASRIIRAGEVGGPEMGVAAFAKELNDATKGLVDFGKVTDATTRGLVAGGRGALGAGAALAGAGMSLSGAGFAKNTAAKVARQTVRAAGFDLLNFAATQIAGGGLGAMAGNITAGDVSFSVAKGLSQNPTLAKAFSLDLNLTPYLQAGQRTLGITGALARLGVAPDQIAEVREAAFGRMVPEEKRAAVEARAVEAMSREAAGTEALEQVDAFSDATIGELGRMINGIVDSAFTRLGLLLGAGPGGPAAAAAQPAR